MCMYLRTKLQVSSIILTGFIQGRVILTNSPSPPQKEPIKSPPRLELIRIHYTHDYTATTSHGVARKESTIILKYTVNLFRRNLKRCLFILDLISFAS